MKNLFKKSLDLAIIALTIAPIAVILIAKILETPELLVAVPVSILGLFVACEIQQKVD